MRSAVNVTQRFEDARQSVTEHCDRHHIAISLRALVCESIGEKVMLATGRTLKDITYSECIPAYGCCSKCGMRFTTSLEAQANPEEATRDFYSAFGVHECKEDTSQGATRF
jgi:hypothetical protein